MENLKFKDIRQYRTKSVWRLCTPSACRFSVILPRNPLPYDCVRGRILPENKGVSH